MPLTSINLCVHTQIKNERRERERGVSWRERGTGIEEGSPF